MNIPLYNLLAFMAVLVAIVVLSLSGKATDVSIMVGLVGVLGTFKPWSASGHTGPEGTKGDPLSVQGAGKGSTPVSTEASQEPER